MAYARIPVLREFPGRQTRVNIIESWEVEFPMTYVTQDGKRGIDFTQGVAFKEVSAELAAELEKVAYRTAFPLGVDNPARFEIVATREEADRIEAADREALVRRAGGRKYATIGKAV